MRVFVCIVLKKGDEALPAPQPTLLLLAALHADGSHPALHGGPGRRYKVGLTLATLPGIQQLREG